MQQHVTIRLSEEVLRRVDDYRKMLKEQTGLTVDRSAALRALIEEGLKQRMA